MAETGYQKVLYALKESGGGLAVRELTSSTKLSALAVRRTLNVLLAKNLVFAKSVHQAVGRPANTYYLTDEGHESFSRDYAGLANELLLSVRSLDGNQHITELVQWRKQKQIDEIKERFQGKGLEVRIQEMSRLLSEQGYMASWERSNESCYLLKLMNCPITQVARKFPHLCVCEEQLLSELLGTKVTRQHYLLSKDHFCSYLIEA